MSRDSFVPENEPGGGGWSLQQITLSSLYFDNTNYLLNWWTTSNKGLNLLRFLGTEITLFRQPYTDIIFSHFPETPKTVSKFYYAGLHPIKMLNYNEKIVVPSFNTQPHKKKPFKKIFIPPPKLWQNKWYFQQQVCDYPLIQFTSTATSLTELFGSRKARNNNITLFCLDTTFFTSPHFQYRKDTTPWKPTNKHMYALQRGELPITTHKWSDLTYIGQTMLNEPGFAINNYTTTSYTSGYWGNPFYYQYMNLEEHTFLSTTDLNTAVGRKTSMISAGDMILKTTPAYNNIRYNPWKDNGKGNLVYWIPNVQATKQNWEPLPDPDLQIGDYPLWILLYGWEDMTRRIGKITNIDNDWILVIRCNYMYPKEKEYVPLNESFIHGQGPYDVDRSEIKPSDNAHWYPRFRFQREAINSIIESGPGIAHNSFSKNEQAFIKYKFLFKWGGCPSTMENIYDPKSQPITPTPNNFDLLNEITDPQTSIENFIYPWDTRRDQLTQKATTRITEGPTNDSYVFTDGKFSSTDIPLGKTTQTPTSEETPQAQETTLLEQLNQLQQLNQQLQFRFNNLKLQMQNM